ncbi:MAG: M90 family metallopeptidase [Sulfuricaulis sp.]
MTTSRKPAPRRAARVFPDGLKKLFRRWRSRRHPLPDGLWSTVLRTSSYAGALPKPDRARLRELAGRFMETKSFEGARGLTVSETMRARIALHACIPIFNLGLEYYDDWASVVVYPGDFRVHDEYMDELGVVHRETLDLCGLSQTRGPIVLSWEAIRVEDETVTHRNLVIHECAHKLDVLNGNANGFPPLHAGMKPGEWSREFHAAYDRLCSSLRAGVSGRIDAYAGSDPAEFFAVLSETFFTAPRFIAEDFPTVYRQMARFYRQDPFHILPATPA